MFANFRHLVIALVLTLVWGTAANAAPPLDGTVAVAAYSFRKLRTDYAGAAVQLRRDSDNRTRNIGFTFAGDFDRSAAAGFCGNARCFVAKFFDQSGNANTLAQAIAAKQPRYIAAGSATGQPVARWCAACGFAAADSATYKTAAIDAFMVVKIGLPPPESGPSSLVVGYPHSATSDVTDLDWGLSNQGGADVLQFQIYGPGGYDHGSENPSGFGAAYRGALYQYEFDTAERSLKYNQTLFYDGTDAAIRYPARVGLRVGMDATGKSNMVGGELAELVLYGSTQTKRAAISANQSAYWGIAAPPARVTSADGQQWAPVYTGNFNSSGGPLAGKYVKIGGRRYFTESAWDRYSLWQGVNVSTGRDLTRFEVHRGDVDDLNGNERSELDGAASRSWQPDHTVQLSYAVLVEPGAAIADSSWLALGQFHYDNAAYPPASFAFDFARDKWHVDIDGSANPVEVYASPPAKRGRWYDFFIEQRISSTGQADVFKVWIDGVQVVNTSGALFPHGRQAGYWKFGIYRGDIVKEALAVRYANMEVVDKAVTDISSRIAAPLPHP